MFLPTPKVLRTVTVPNTNQATLRAIVREDFLPESSARNLVVLVLEEALVNVVLDNRRREQVHNAIFLHAAYVVPERPPTHWVRSLKVCSLEPYQAVDVRNISALLLVKTKN